jgi:Rps23 Pro-64 3,4-dihydroxylase Tpa1-like proline 4-hydroxylase
MTATAQTSETSTGKTALANAQKEVHQEAAAVNREAQQLLLELRIQRLIAEVKSGRVLTEKQREELSAADGQLTVERSNNASLEKSIHFATVEIADLRSAIGFQKDALEAKSETISVLKERNDELKKSASKNRKRAFWATAAAVILGGVLVMK